MAEINEEIYFEKEINMTFEQYQCLVFNYTFINSLAFANDIEDYMKKYINNHINTDYYTPELFCDLIEWWLDENQERACLDEKVKSNIYYLYELFLSKNDDIDKLEKHEKINNLKRILNSFDNDNTEFLKKQLIIRDYGMECTPKNIRKIEKIGFNKEIIEDVKSALYDSISADMSVLNILLINDGKFYSDYYKQYLLHKNFYRSINYFMLVHPLVLMDGECLNRINYIFDEDKKILKEKNDIVDKEFNDIKKSSFKLVKKIV